MKIIRSKGQSFTDYKKDESGPSASVGQLERGLELNPEQKLAHSKYENKPLVSGAELVRYVGEDHALVLRQAISVLDKVVRPPRRLRDFELKVYIDRAKLAHELWKLVWEKSKDDLLKRGSHGEVETIFKKAWDERAHPYTRDPALPLNPASDENGKYLAKHSKDGVEYKQFEGRWRKALWKTGNTGQPDYAATAQAIMGHLFEQELQFDGQEKTKGGHETTADENSGKAEKTGMGLIEARGLTIKGSVNDPRTGKRLAKNAVITAAATTIDDLYFRQDIASKISHAFDDEIVDSSPSKVIGALLYEHLPTVLEAVKGDEDTKKAIWLRHNQVRQFYQKLTRSNRFRMALRTKDVTKLRSLLPGDSAALKRVLGAKADNADVSELIRLGKIIAHSADIRLPLASGENLQKTFEARLNHFATSAGQSEIKRNEAFTRLWRTSVALSLRTLTTWVKPILPENQRDQDITDNNFKNNLNKLLQPDSQEKFSWKHIDLIFGNKAYPPLSPKSRSDIFYPDEGENIWSDRLEIIWALVRLATQIRHGTNHFNIRHRLVDKITNGLLNGSQNPGAIANRPGNIVDQSVLERFSQLLEFDIALQRHVLLDDLNALEVGNYVSEENLKTLLAELGKGPSDTDVTTPKFMALLRRAHNLAQGEVSEYGKGKLPKEPGFPSTHELRHFGTLDLNNLSKPKGGGSGNHVRIGLLRHLYRTGFPAWLEAKKKNGDLHKAIQQVFDARAFWEEAFAEEQRVVAKGTVSQGDRDTDALKDLSSLFAALAAKAAGEERLRRQSNSRAKTREKVRLQSGGKPSSKERPSWQATLAQDVYGHLFAEYIADRVEWIWGINHPTDEEAEPLTLEIIPALGWSPEERADWESQFYTWLYLVPSDQVSLLRHQLHKTLALDALARERVSGGDEDARETDIDTLSRMSRLMALHGAVQEAGFSGEEHTIHYGARGDEIGKIFYANPSQFTDVHDVDQHESVVPGTRRGLRQVLKFGHLPSVQRIYEKHRVSEQEVQDLIAIFGERKEGSYNRILCTALK